MSLVAIDWAVIVGYLLLIVMAGLFCSKRAGRSMTDFFVSGRQLPWWLAGTSMVATTFAADTPLAVTALMVRDGLAGNWFWWAFAVGGMLTTFVFAPLWRRSEVVTDNELVEFRYGGRPAALLRGIRAIYMALLVNAIIMGWVTIAMLTVLTEVLPASTPWYVEPWTVVLVLLLLVGVYSTWAGLWGVAIADFIQFFLAMGGCIALAVLAVKHVGGMSQLHGMVVAEWGEGALDFLPRFSADRGSLSWDVFLIMILVQWWAAWYPGAEPGGGGYVVQRMASCRDERHSLLATLWFQVAHYCVRPWPWIVVAMSAMALHPQALRSASDPGVGFPIIMREHAPPGLRGLLLVAFFAAYMSTISTQLNWGASYLVADFYKRFLQPQASPRNLVWASRVASVLTLAAGIVAAVLLQHRSVDEIWKVLTALGAGSGAVYILRWFWWRINAWSEISAMLASCIFYLALSRHSGFAAMRPEYHLALVAVPTICTWLLVTWITPAERADVLVTFYRRVRPPGPGWSPIARVAEDVEVSDKLIESLGAAAMGTLLIYFMIPSLGGWLLGDVPKAAATSAVALLCALILWKWTARLSELHATVKPPECA